MRASFPVLVLLAIEEFVALDFGHLHNTAGFAFALPFLRLGVDWLASDLRDSGRVARIGAHA